VLLREARATVKSLEVELNRRGESDATSTSASPSTADAPAHASPVKKGRPARTIEQLKTQVKTLQKTLQRIQQDVSEDCSSEDESDSESGESLTVKEREARENGRAFVELVKGAGMTFEGSRQAYTYRSGLFIQELNVGGQVSFEKMALVVSLVVSFFVGSIDQQSADILFRCADTMAVAAEQASIVKHDDCAAKFFQRDRPDRVLAATIGIDESNKAGLDFCMKLATMRTASEKQPYQLRSLRMDAMSSKKSKLSAETSLESLEQELTVEGMPFIRAGIVDAFNGAQKTMNLIVVACNTSAEVYQTPHLIPFNYELQ
jgi:hypothetical protein